MRICDWSSDVCSSDLIREHCRNAVAVAEFLKGHRDVVKVIFPSLQDGESRRRADTYLKGGFGGLVGFELTGGAAAGRRFIDALQLFYHVANLGHARSLAIPPASTPRSEESRVGKACVRTCRSRWSTYHETKKKTN